MAVNLFRFYESILQEELCYVSGDEDEEMDLSLDILLASYSVAGLKTADSLDFNDRKLRCAYLFLFSTSHSHMVLDALNRFHQENCTELLNLIFRASSTHGSFNITSLGGGPGSDPLGILTFLDEKGFLESCPPVKVSVVDEYIGWESTFRQVMEKFNNGLVRAHFKTQDLLLPLSKEVQALLRNTDFLSMVKFVSAISGDKYGAVTCFQRIFNLLQPGTIILIIDNAGGPDFNQVLTVAKTMGLQPILEPVLHYQFKVPKIQEQGLGRMQYGKRPQSSSTISMVILKKYGSSFSNYIEPATNYEEPNLLQARTGRSNGYLTVGLELPPLLEESSLDGSSSEESSSAESTYEEYSSEEYESEVYEPNVYLSEEYSSEEYESEVQESNEYSLEEYSSEDDLSEEYSLEGSSPEECSSPEYTLKEYLLEESSSEESSSEESWSKEFECLLLDDT